MPLNSACQSGSKSKTKSRPLTEEGERAKDRADALPLPPNKDTPPITTAAIELSV